jgi:hypothetical protein
VSCYFETRAAQDVAVMKLLIYIGTSKKCFSQDLLEELEPTDHEITAAMSQGFVVVDWIDGKGGVYLSVSDEGRDWIIINQWKWIRPSPAQSVAHRPL